MVSATVRSSYPDMARTAASYGVRMAPLVRVVLADDHPIWRDGVRADLRDGFWIVGEAGDPDEAIAVIGSTKPDVVVCELNMPGGGGLKVAKTATGANPLSCREREVLQLVARGHTYKAIGAELFIAEKTVENHVRNILGKLHLNRKQELIRYAVEHGLE